MTDTKQPKADYSQTYEKMIGNTLFVVTSECSSTASETLEQKLERLICRHASDTKSYQNKTPESLAMCGNLREHGIGSNT